MCAASDSTSCTYLDFAPPEHLYIVLPRVSGDDEIVVANVTSDGDNIKDRTCVLQPGDHPFVKRQSVIFYQRAKIITAKTLNGWIGRGMVEPKDSASNPLMDRIRQGALDSPFTPNVAKRLVRDCHWVP